MIRITLNSGLYAALITFIYFIGANLGYYLFNRRTMFADIFFYEWVEYALVAGFVFFCMLIIEWVRNFIRFKKSKTLEELEAAEG